MKILHFNLNLECVNTQIHSEYVELTIAGYSYANTTLLTICNENVNIEYFYVEHFTTIVALPSHPFAVNKSEIKV